MTYYHTQVLLIGKQHYPKQCVIDQVIKAKSFIDENCCNEIDLEKISRLANVSKFHFIRLFRNCYGRTPHQYLTEKRMTAAKELLDSGMNVVDTCYHIGFCSPHSFSTTFKKYTGWSPSAFGKRGAQRTLRKTKNTKPSCA